MRRTSLLLLAFALASSLQGEPKRAQIIKAGKKVPDHYIVVLGDRVSDVDDAANSMANLVKAKKSYVFKETIKGFAIVASEKAIEKLAEDPRVAWIEEDSEVWAETSQGGATWGIDRVDQRDLPLSATYEFNATGTGVKAYIIDTGIRQTHSEFGGRAISGYTAISDGNGTNDCNGHGTHVAGTVGGSTYGVAKSVTLVAVRVLNCSGSGLTSGVIAGIDWVTADHAAGAPAVANMSLGGAASTTLDEAVRRSISDGVTYAVAAGNGNTSACNSSPARVAEAITVAASTITDARASFSNFGTCTDVFAPGENITSAWLTDDNATNTISGTSMATPHVTGAAALYLSIDTTASPSIVWSALRDNTTPGKITNPGTGSPNRLLYTFFIGEGGGVPPSISALTPDNGPAGTIVRIDGSEFLGAFAVRFNGRPASFTIVTSSQIDTTVPDCRSSGLVSVTTPGGTAISAGAFTVTGCPPAEQLLLNPGFESGDNGEWTSTPGVIVNYSGRPAHTGLWKAWLGGYGYTHTDYIYQAVAVPAGAVNATLSFWVRIDTAEWVTWFAADRMRVQISNNGGGSWVTLATYSNLDKNPNYVQKSFNLSSYAGQAIVVRFYVTEDYALQTSFVVDDTALDVQYY